MLMLTARQYFTYFEPMEEGYDMIHAYKVTFQIRNSHKYVTGECLGGLKRFESNRVV